MKKLVTFSILAVLAAGLVFAQNSSLQEPNPENVGADSAESALREISVDKFEREGSWNVHMSADDGVITGRLFAGNPAILQKLKTGRYCNEIPDGPQQLQRA